VARARNPYSQAVVMDSGLAASRRPGMTAEGVNCKRQTANAATRGFTKLYLRDTGGKTPAASVPGAGTTA
jgi:hypothetical protein